jgi:hypothetical protein
MWLKPAIFFIHKPSAKADGNIISVGFSQRLNATEKQGFSHIKNKGCLLDNDCIKYFLFLPFGKFSSGFFLIRRS